MCPPVPDNEIFVPGEDSPKRGISAIDRSARISGMPRRAARIVQGRQRLSKVAAQRNAVGRVLATLRQAAGLSQAELAEKMGMSRSALAGFEKKPGAPRASVLQKLASALELPIEEVIAAVEATNQAMDARDQPETDMPSENSPYLKFTSGETIRDYRREHGLSQTAFWNPIGTTQSGGSRYEAGRTIPRQVQMLLQLAYGSPQEADALLSWMRDAGRASVKEESGAAMTAEQDEQRGRTSALSGT